MEDIYYKVKIKLKSGEEIIDIKSIYSYLNKCHLFVFSTNKNRDIVIEVEESRK